MIIDLNEEEREFLLRIVERAIIFLEMGINVPSTYLKDKEKSIALKKKLEEA